MLAKIRAARARASSAGGGGQAGRVGAAVPGLSAASIECAARPAWTSLSRAPRCHGPRKYGVERACASPPPPAEGAAGLFSPRRSGRRGGLPPGSRRLIDGAAGGRFENAADYRPRLICGPGRRAQEARAGQYERPGAFRREVAPDGAADRGAPENGGDFGSEDEVARRLGGLVR